MSHSIRGSTQAYLIPGDPVRNVRLPRMFNAAFERYDIDAVLLPMQVPVRDFAVFFKSAFLARNVRGMVIAPPHKPLVVDLLDGCGLFGRVAGSVNVVRRTEGDQLEGDLFDGEGLIGALDHCNIPFRGKRVLILGAGVSAAAIGVALAEGGTVNGAEHIAFSRHRRRQGRRRGRQAECLLRRDRGRGGSNAPEGYDLVINATPLGLVEGDALPVDVARMDAMRRCSTSCCATSPRRWCARRVRAGSTRRRASRCSSSRCRTTCATSATWTRPQALQADADFLREIVYPPAMHAEIAQPLRYHSPSVA
jgi:shikimate dehydrogenase